MDNTSTYPIVTLLLPSLKFGGAERVALTLAEALKDEGILVDILVMSLQGEFLAEAQLKFNVVDLKCDKTFKLPWKLTKYIRKVRPIALLSSFWKLNLCSCLARIAAPDMRLLLWEHSQPSLSRNSPRWLYAISASILYRMATKVVAVSTGVYNDIDRWTLGLKGRLTVIFNPVAPPVGIIPRAQHAHRGKRIVWVGRLDWPKNPGLALEAFALVRRKTDASLTFVGDGPQRADLERRCAQLGLSDHVAFAGFHPRPYEAIAAADLLVLSSDREGLGNVIIEALYCGLRVVCTDCGEGVHDILLDNRWGTIVPIGNKVAMAEAVARELGSPWDPALQMEAAIKFLPQVIVRQFLAIIQK